MIKRNPLTGAIQPYQSAMPTGVSTNGLPPPPMGSAQYQFGRPNPLTQMGSFDPNAPFVNPRPQTQPQQVVPVTAPVKPTNPMAQGLLANNAPVQDGLLGASAAALSLGGNTRTPTSMGQVIGKALQGYRSGELAGVKRQREEKEYAMKMATAKQATIGRDQLAQAYPHMADAIRGGLVDPKDQYQEVDGSLIDTWAMRAPGAQPIKKKIDQSKLFDPDGNMNRKGQLKYEADWRKEIKPTVKLVRETVTAVNKVTASLKRKTGTADIAGINSYQRLIDDAAVRGEDIALQASTVSWFGQLARYKTKAATGQLLPQNIRTEMAAMALALQQSTTSNARIEMQGYKDVVDRTPGIKWDRILPTTMDKWFEGVIAPDPKTDANLFESEPDD